MVLKRVIPTLTVSAACALGAIPVASASASTDVSQASSGNWSGYVVGDDASDGSSGRFKSVTGSWVQPTAKCSASSSETFSAFWVGLGGVSSSQKLEQDGTEANCSATGKVSYYAWYELVPHAPVKVDLAVHPGDQMTATTTVDGDQTTFSIIDHTTGQSFDKAITFSNPDTSSAEWIAEAPSECQGSVNNCTTLPLSNFGSVKFTSASATDAAGHAGTISDNDWQTDALTLSPGGGSQFSSFEPVTSGGGARPSSLSSDGSSFSVAYSGARQSSTGGSGGGGFSGGSSGGSSGFGGGSTGGYGGGSAGGWGDPDPYAVVYPTGNGGYVIVYSY
jgi:Peptidase A4 family